MKSLKILITFIFGGLTVGCSTDWLNINPPHLITAETLYTSLDGFEAGLNGLYHNVRAERDGLSGVNDIRTETFMNGTDNLVTNYRTGFSTIAEFWGANNNPQNSFFSGMFSWLYETINAANTIINRAEQGNEIDWTEAEKNRVIAEARGVRAWAYRHLTYGWGDVPLSLDEAFGSTIRTDWVRTPVRQVREQIIEDLLFAQEHIPVGASLPGRMTKGAAQHYLAEMYLALDGRYPPSAENVQQALYWANQVVDNPDYRLITERYGVKSGQRGVPYMDMFYDGNTNRSEGNTEALWVFQYAQNTIGGQGHIMRRTHGSRVRVWSVGGVIPIQLTLERGGQGEGRVSLTKWAIDAYEPQDDRASEFALRKFFVLKDAAGNAPYPADRLPQGYSYGDTLWFDWSRDITAPFRPDWPWCRKVEGTDPDNMNAQRQWNDQVYLRLAETYLLKAEAQYLLGDLDGAAETINVIRRRSNASEIGTADIDLDFILDERSRELVMEEHRRHTLLRTGRWLERTRAHNRNGGQLIVQRDTLFPIPQTVIDANLTHEMRQNPGY